jgi:hypothetical protein
MTRAADAEKEILTSLDQCIASVEARVTLLEEQVKVSHAELEELKHARALVTARHVPQGPPMHVWTAHGKAWVVAETPEDAARVYQENVGSLDGELGSHSEEWTRIPAGRVLTMQESCPETHTVGARCARGCDSRHLLYQKKTAAEWAESGRALLVGADG